MLELLPVALVDFASVPLFVYVGQRVVRRSVSAIARPANLMLALFWTALAGHSLVDGILTTLALNPPIPFALEISLINLRSLLLCLFLWGVTGYLIYLLAGRYHYALPSVLYGSYYLLLQYFLIDDLAELYNASTGQVRVLFAAPIPAAVAWGITIAVIAPPIVAAIVYLTLYARSTDPTVVYRILMVGVALLIWFGPAAVYLAMGLPAELLVVGCQVLALLLVALAYFPPRSLQARWHVTGLEDRWSRAA